MRLQAFIGDFQDHAFEQFQAAGSSLTGQPSSHWRSNSADGCTNTPGSKLAHQVQQAGKKHIEVVRQQRRTTSGGCDTYIMGDVDLLGLEQAHKVVEFGLFCLSKGQALLGQRRVVFFPLDFIGSGLTTIALDPLRQVRGIGIHAQ
ncbi:hypothetical protein D3C79_663110 [compost metagenome]